MGFPGFVFLVETKSLLVSPRRQKIRRLVPWRGTQAKLVSLFTGKQEQESHLGEVQPNWLTSRCLGGLEVMALLGSYPLETTHDLD